MDINNNNNNAITSQIISTHSLHSIIFWSHDTHNKQTHATLFVQGFPSTPLSHIYRKHMDFPAKRR